MADRFPTIEDFDEGDATVPSATEDVGGEDDFLARERAALGDDAALFANADDTAAARSGTVADGDGDDDLLGGVGDESSGPAAGGAFASSFPAIDTGNNQVGPDGTITGSTYGQQSSYSVPEEEPEVIKEWRERRNLALSHRAEVAAKKKEETVSAAQISIDDFYENYNNKKEKSLNATRKEAEEFLKSREDTTAGGTSWERIAKLVDLSGKGVKGGAAGSGKEKFRELLMNLRKDEKAPGASGV